MNRPFIKNYSNPDAPCYANSQCSSKVQFQNSRHAYKVWVLIATYPKCFKHAATIAIASCLNCNYRNKRMRFSKERSICSFLLQNFHMLHPMVQIIYMFYKSVSFLRILIICFDVNIQIFCECLLSRKLARAKFRNAKLEK